MADFTVGDTVTVDLILADGTGVPVAGKLANLAVVLATLPGGTWTPVLTEKETDQSPSSVSCWALGNLSV